MLMVLLGTYIAWREIPPYEPWLRQAYVAGNALFDPTDEYSSDVWMEEPASTSPEVGIIVWDKERASPGLTLITAGEGAHLLDMNGEVVHSWSYAYDELPAEGRMVAETVQVRRYWQRAHVLPNGDIVVMMNMTRSSPDGLALIRLDKDSNLLWHRYGYFHHDFDLDKAGNIYALDQSILTETPDALPTMRAPVLDEAVVVLSPDGELMARHSIVDAISRSRYTQFIKRFVHENSEHWGDYMHNNNVDVADTDTAALFPFVNEGDILLSMREVDSLAVLDPREGRLTWAARGSWHRQHDPDFLPNGNLLIFDNKGDWERDGHSRVIEYHPATGAIVWQYPDKGTGRLHSDYRAEQQWLPNNNILINEFTKRRLLEVTRDGDTVWEYRCHLRYEVDPDLLCRAMSSQRYSYSELEFVGRRIAAATGPAVQ